MRIGIITRNQNRSPKVLALSLQAQLNEMGIASEVIYATDFLVRLQPVRFSFNAIRTLLRRMKHLPGDISLLLGLRKFDLLILSDCIPSAFRSDRYAIEILRSKTRRPILLYEVYYLGNAPSQIQHLKETNNPLQERYDWHLSVSPITEIRSPEQPPWSCIGLDLTHTDLSPVVKNKFMALVDFPHPDPQYAGHREMQLRVLSQLGIKTICLNGEYSIEEIRALYREATFYFMQGSEAFGLPLAECFACGAVAFAASSSWPMSWRLDEEPTLCGEGTLGQGLFYVYRNEDELLEKLHLLLHTYDLSKTPFRVFEQFIHAYPYYFYGRSSALKDALGNFAPDEVQQSVVTARKGHCKHELTPRRDEAG